MRVRVAVDVTKPLCRGRVMTWDGREGWVLFMYERLSKICYWCGRLSHDDKECAVWLSSKGDLSGAGQQFGPWLRTAQFNLARKTRVEVQGYDAMGTHRTIPGTTENRKMHLGKANAISSLAGLFTTDAGATHIVDPITTASRVVENSGDTRKCDEHVLGRNTAGPQEQIPDFKAMIKDIDDAINMDSVISISNTHNPDSSQLLAGNDQHVGINKDTTEVLGIKDGNWEKVEAKLASHLTKLAPTEVKFEMGWVEKHMEGKESKSGPKMCGGKSKSKLKTSNGPAEEVEDFARKQKRAQQGEFGLDYALDPLIMMGWSVEMGERIQNENMTTL